jgi:hypothetical protein
VKGEKKGREKFKKKKKSQNQPPQRKMDVLSELWGTKQVWFSVNPRGTTTSARNELTLESLVSIYSTVNNE